MAEETTTDSPDGGGEPVENVTVVNIQRIESGYFDHMQSLRDRVPVADYLNDDETSRYALFLMIGITIGLFILFPFTMFYGYTYLVTLVYLVAFVVIGKLFYDRIVVPNEGTETWRE